MSAATPSILIVDDDHLALESLRALFQIETDYAVTCIDHPRLALEEFSRRPIDIIICDYLMPHMNGIELLRKLRKTQPETVRILLTGFADKENVVRAINEVGLYQYLEKPWDNDALLIAVRNALREKSLRRQMAEKVRELDQLFWEHKQLSKRHSDLEQEIEMAARVQKSLLPSEVPTISGFVVDTLYRPCGTLGGDFYDFARDEARAVILAADVSGHGTQAALTSMLLKASFHEAFQKTAAPGEMLEWMNATLHRFLPLGMYVAATVLSIEAPDRVWAVNAGLPYPCVWRRSRQRVDQLPLRGIPLALFPDRGLEPWDVHNVPLEPGDVLCLASDGLGEITNDRGELFQDQELFTALSAMGDAAGSDLLEALLEKAIRFGDGRVLQDDLTLVAISRM